MKVQNPRGNKIKLDVGQIVKEARAEQQQISVVSPKTKHVIKVLNEKKRKPSKAGKPPSPLKQRRGEPIAQSAGQGLAGVPAQIKQNQSRSLVPPEPVSYQYSEPAPPQQ